ncbi:phytosulfokine receptor 1 [Quercus lobata]|uniref:non-specific serine/threonine protein kinase n=1 Tax=Quercus lobata TaxID=97700 RepID=A0A7N2L8G0_QUELO|nr:phytosulfokine receptor 1 [Quercus lobata]
MGIKYLCLMMMVLGFCFQSQLLSAQNLTCHPNDRSALVDFMNGLKSVIEGWDTNSSSDCCTWPGINCSSSISLGLSTSSGNYERVVVLNLFKKKISGKLSESLGKLDQLRTLNLSHNLLQDSLPQSLFSLQKLEFLDLSSNDFSGSIPEAINLTSINTIDMSQNVLNGSIPGDICINSKRILILNLAVNYLSGDLSALANCSSLHHLYLGANDFTGGIPDNIFQLHSLESLSLQDNNFSGPLSKEIGKLQNLSRLDLSANGFLGSIPDVFYSFRYLKYFAAHSNNFTGQIPESLSNSPSLILLNLRNNSLGGKIELNCSTMLSLNSLDLGSNRFSGPVPDNLPNCHNLETLNLARNNLSGQIPETFDKFQSLSYLSLSNSSISNLTSALKILQQCQNLTTLVLTLNFHGEELPADLSLHFKSLKVLVVANCRLTGVIPQWLSRSNELEVLDLSWNCLNGAIPEWFGNFTSLFYLDLSNNSFTGEIPKSLTGLVSLISRNISLVDPSPDFPFFMKKNVSARGLQYKQVLSFPPTLELSHNNLTGKIWPEFGNLKKLHVLNLQFNSLSGQIPSDLSGMTSLEALDLSYNNLTGTIPPSLQSLSFCSKFNVAYNHLSGDIPLGGQFRTFPNSSFEGNNLCDAPCQQLRGVPHPPPSHNKSGRNVGSIIGMSIGIVFGTAFLLIIMFMIVIRAYSRREVDPEKEEAVTDGKDLEELGSKSVVLFRNKESSKELSLDDLLKSTNNFDQANIIGCGGFGLVYRATLPDGKKVAIKRLSGDCGQMDREFRAEVEALSRAQHPNLVHLQGYCMYKNDRLLIYSYMENSSLDYWLHEKLDGPSSLDWDTRLQIAQGAARGLAYLHQSCEPHILHRDIKSSNILLNENFEAHLADFGLARLLLSPYDTHVTTDLVGTLGYIPPEYGQASVASYKGDVYSFGVVLLELLTGKRPMDMCKPKGFRDLISWVFEMKKENRESEVFDPFVYDKQNDKEMLRMLEIACLCLSESPKVRPSTQQLVSWLDNIDINI